MLNQDAQITKSLPKCEPWELESTSFNALTSKERDAVSRIMESIIDISRESGLDLWRLNPRANATQEKLSQWIIDRRATSTPGVALSK